MEVLLLKDVSSLGFAGQVKKVNAGYARNYLFPKKLAKVATISEVASFQKNVKKADVDTVIVGSRLASLSQQIKNLHLTLEKKVHDDNKLYGSVSQDEVLELLKQNNLTISKKQIEFGKTIRNTGEHEIIIKLSSKVKPQLILKVVAAK